MQAGDFTAKKEIVRLEQRGVQEEGPGILSFEFRKQLFEYDEASNSFSKLAFPVEVSSLSHFRMQQVYTYLQRNIYSTAGHHAECMQDCEDRF